MRRLLVKSQSRASGEARATALRGHHDVAAIAERRIGAAGAQVVTAIGAPHTMRIAPRSSPRPRPGGAFPSRRIARPGGSHSAPSMLRIAPAGNQPIVVVD